MKTLSFVGGIMLTGIILTGCAEQKIMTPEEIAAERSRQLEMITRCYPDKKTNEILVAADNVFRLADDDYKISHAPTSLSAQRNWILYLVITAAFGTDTWTVTTEPLPNGGTKVMVTHSGQGSSMFAGPVANPSGGTGVSAVTTPSLQNITTSPAIYDLFYARLDYFLEKRSDWIDCKQAKEIFTDGFLDPLCTVATDRTPDGKSAAQRSKERTSKHQ